MKTLLLLLSAAGSVTFAQTIQLTDQPAMNLFAVITGNPFSAQAITQTVQTLADGNRITRSSSSSVYRDAQGRQRRELPTLNAPLELRNQILIADPVTGVNWTLTPSFHTAIRTERSAAVPPFPPIPASARSAPKTEDLGTMNVEGLQAKGTRTTLTYAAGEIGNQQPFSVVNEVWYSTDLQVILVSKHSDPRSGDVTYRLTEIKRSEPPASAFEVPSGYTIRELPVR